MAMSLEDLLTKEGFNKSRRSKTMSRASISSEPDAKPVYPLLVQSKSGPSTSVRRTNRTKSDIHQYHQPTSEKVKGTRPRDNLIRNERLMKETRMKLDRKGSSDFWEGSRYGIRPSKNFPDSGIVDAEEDRYEFEDDERYIDIYSNDVYSPSRSTAKFPNGSGERIASRNISGKNMLVDKRYKDNSNKSLLSGMSSNNQKSMKQSGALYSRSNENFQNNKSFEERENRKQVEIEQVEPALDEVAVQAMISLLTGYIKRFLRDEDFRTSLRHNCFASLNFVGLEEGPKTESKIIDNLEQAIETVERAAEDSVSGKELKKASLQLSVITGLNANDLKDGFTSGIPNSKLSACAHLYLSVIYKLQKKDRIAAKHLLQVFCDSPFPARTTLLPELWDDIFLPHLSHLQEWFNQEVDSLENELNKGRKLKLLEKVYNEIMDSGTYQFAAYYKDWLTKGVEAPSIPSIHIPSVSVQGAKQIGFKSHSPELCSPRVPLSPQPVVSKLLYDSLFGSSASSGADRVTDFEASENYDISRRSTAKETKTNSSDAEDVKDLDFQQNVASQLEGGPGAEEEHHEFSGPGEGDFNDESDNSYQLQPVTESTNLSHEFSYTKVNELTLKRLARTFFGMKQTEECADDIDYVLSLHDDENTKYPYLLPAQLRSFSKGFNENYDYFDGRPSFLSIPQDFICPLTGVSFEDPVTLETGQTFETAAIAEWFDKGYKTCPLTGKTLEYQAVPQTNFIMKRVVDSWKSDHCRNLLSFASELAGTEGEHIKFKDEACVSILENMFTFFSRKETMSNARLLISFGGLEFLIQRFGCGNLEEKTCIAALLSHCIDADSNCRNYIAKNIDIAPFVELVQNKQVKSRENAVSLLTKLICLKRRKDVRFFLIGLQKNKGLVSTLHALLVYLHSSPLEQKPLVAALMLHLDLLMEAKTYSIYREEAVDAIAMCLEKSLFDEKIREVCCHTLLVLGGRFSFSGKVMTEDCILKKAGCIDCNELEVCDNEGIVPEDNIQSDSDDEEANEDWLRNLSASLLGDGRKSFLETVSLCLSSVHLDLVRVCLVTVAWLSSSLASSTDAEFKLSAFSTLVSGLKESLENGDRVEHKILASMSLLNFSKIPECRVLLLTIAADIEIPLRSLVEVTWTAKELYGTIFRRKT